MQELIDKIRGAVARRQPELNVSIDADTIIVDGRFVVSSPEGPFDYYDVRITITAGFPLEEPRVFETGNRLPRVIDRHVFPSGACCLGIWEEWLIKSDRSFDTFLTGIAHDYFVSQTHFELKGVWPFGERSHGNIGIVESYADVLGVSRELGVVCRYLESLNRLTVKGHIICPCGSGKRVRNCHSDKINDLRRRIAPDLAKRMLDRVRPKR